MVPALTIAQQMMANGIDKDLSVLSSIRGMVKWVTLLGRVFKIHSFSALFHRIFDVDKLHGEMGHPVRGEIR